MCVCVCAGVCVLCVCVYGSPCVCMCQHSLVLRVGFLFQLLDCITNMFLSTLSGFLDNLTVCGTQSVRHHDGDEAKDIGRAVLGCTSFADFLWDFWLSRVSILLNCFGVCLRLSL